MGMSIEGLASEASKLTVPAKAMGAIYIDTAEKLVDLQMESSKVYSDIAFNQLKKIPTIHNIEEAGDFLWGQIEPFSEFNKQLLSDWKSLMALNTEVTNSMKSVFSRQKSEPVESIITPEKTEKPEPVTKISSTKRTTRRTKKATSE